MTTRSLRVCAEDGCPELTTGSYCQAHQRDKRQASDHKRQDTRSNYGGSRWRQTRRAYLRAHPICERCPRIANIVHHIDGHGLHGPRAYDPANLEALCKPCHDKHTAQEQPGGWHTAS